MGLSLQECVENLWQSFYSFSISYKFCKVYMVTVASAKRIEMEFIAIHYIMLYLSQK